MTLQEAAVSLNNLDLLASQVVEGFITGLHRSPFHGFSVEFAEHRLYNTGESTKNIDWKLLARTDKLFIKRYEEETNLRCHLLLDTSSSMYYPKPNNDKIKFATIAVAALSNLLKKQRDAFALTQFSDKVNYQSDVRSSSSHYHHIISQLQSSIHHQSESKTSEISETLNVIAEQIHRRSLVVILSDMFEQTDHTEELMNALQHLKFKKHEVIIFHVVDGNSELEFNFENRPYKFIDTETKEEIKLYPDEIKESYLNQINEHKRQIQLKCSQYKIDYVEADIRKDFSQILMPFFIKRQRLV